MKSFLKIIKSKKFQYIIFALILIYSAFFRFRGVFTNSFPFTYDIGRDLIAAREIATLEKFTLIGPTTGLEGLFYGPSWYYILALIYHPLLGDPVLITGFIVATGLLVVIISFYLGKKINGSFFGILWAGLLAFSPAIISLTSQIWSPNLIPILWILSYFLLYNIFSEKKMILNSFLLGLLLSLIVDMEIVVGLLYSAGIMLGLLLFRRKVFSIKNIIFAILGFLLVLSPRILFDIRHNFLLSKSFVQGVSHMIFEGGTGGSVTPFSQKINILFSLWSDTIALSNKVLGLIILVFIFFMTIWFYRHGEGKTKFFLQITLATIVTSIIGIFLMGHDIWSHYLLMFPTLFITWIAIVLALIYNSKKYRYLAIVMSILLILINSNFINYINELRKPLWEGNAAVYRNQVAVVDYVYQTAGERPFKYIVYTPPVHDYTYRYLFNWYGEREYNQVPNEEDAELLFIILEPDHEQPQRLIEWLKLRENDGEIVDEALVKGGIVVQTRQLDKN